MKIDTSSSQMIREFLETMNQRDFFGLRQIHVSNQIIEIRMIREGKGRIGSIPGLLPSIHSLTGHSDGVAVFYVPEHR